MEIGNKLKERCTVCECISSTFISLNVMYAIDSVTRIFGQIKSRPTNNFDRVIGQLTILS